MIVSNTEDHSDPEGHYEQVGAMLERVTAQRRSRESRPLIMFTSGSKDYGDMTEVLGDPGLRPHTESSPIRPHPFAAARAAFAERLLSRRSDQYDVVVLRPALMYGRAAGLFGLLFDFADRSSSSLTLKARPQTIMHAIHVDDCAAAYVALALHSDRDRVANQAFNIATLEYETTEQIAKALADCYGRKLVFEEPDDDLSGFNASLLANTSQWVASAKIRELTGWVETMPRLPVGMAEYRMAYEAARATQS